MYNDCNCGTPAGLGDWSDIIDSIGNTASRIITGVRQPVYNSPSYGGGAYGSPPFSGGPTVPIYYPQGMSYDPYEPPYGQPPAASSLSSMLPYLAVGLGVLFFATKK